MKQDVQGSKGVYAALKMLAERVNAMVVGAVGRAMRRAVRRGHRGRDLPVTFICAGERR